MTTREATTIHCSVPGRVAAGVNERVRAEAAAMLKDEALIEPAFAFRVHALKSRRGDRFELDAATLCVPAFDSLTGTVSALAAAVCSIGPALERRVSGLFASREPLLALALDALGTEKLFALADRTAIRIRREARSRQLQAGTEANPGDTGFPIEEQAKVVALAGESVVRLDGSMLRPVKSTSFVVPLGTGLPVPLLFQRCQRCSSRDKCSSRLN